MIKKRLLCCWLCIHVHPNPTSVGFRQVCVRSRVGLRMGSGWLEGWGEGDPVRVKARGPGVQLASEGPIRLRLVWASKFSPPTWQSMHSLSESNDQMQYVMLRIHTISPLCGRAFRTYDVCHRSALHHLGHECWGGAAAGGIGSCHLAGRWQCWVCVRG